MSLEPFKADETRYSVVYFGCSSGLSSVWPSCTGCSGDARAHHVSLEKRSSKIRLHRLKFQIKAANVACATTCFGIAGNAWLQCPRYCALPEENVLEVVNGFKKLR